MHIAGKPFEYSIGPKNAKLALVGEAHGEEEAKTGIPFCGYSGQELTRMLTQAGLRRQECFITNTFAIRPKDNNIENLCAKRDEVGESYSLKPLKQGKYFKVEYLSELSRLKEELIKVNPNLIVCLGGTAAWAVIENPAVAATRGAIHESTLIPGKKALVTYHPAGVMRNWSWRPIVIADLMKAAKEKEFPEIIRPERTALIRPTLKEIEDWIKRPATMYACDIETFHKTISCIGFARSPKDLICIPFLDMSQPSRSYWATLEDELKARALVQVLLASPIPKLFHNGLFDCQYLYREGFKVFNALYDSMLLQHSLYPEMLKGLGFLGSVHCNEAAWKLLKLKDREDYKRDE